MARHRVDLERDGSWSSVAMTWSPMLVGVGIMLGFVVYALVLHASRVPPVGPELAALPPSPPVAASPGMEVDREVTTVARQARAVAPLESPPSPPPPPPAPSEPAPAPPPAPDVVGTYRIDASYPDVFIGKVVIVNTSRQDRNWTVELAFPDNVGKLNTFWVDGTPQPTLRRSGDTYVFASTVPVPAGSQVVLKFHFDRTGRDVSPAICTVNGNSCGY